MLSKLALTSIFPRFESINLVALTSLVSFFVACSTGNNLRENDASSDSLVSVSGQTTRVRDNEVAPHSNCGFALEAERNNSVEILQKFASSMSMEELEVERRVHQNSVVLANIITASIEELMFNGATNSVEILKHENYLERFDTSPRAETILNNLEILLYERTVVYRDLNELYSFLDKFPNSRFANEIIELITLISKPAFDDALHEGTVTALELFRKNYDRSLLADDALEIIKSANLLE